MSRSFFISYRRSDTETLALRLEAALSERYGAKRVFLDRKDLAQGVRWREEITREITACDTMLVLIGPRWLETLGARSGSDDVLCFEVTTALRLGRSVLPVLAEGATMPQADALPVDLRDLTEFQAAPLRAESFDHNLRALLGRLQPEWTLGLLWAVANFGGWVLGMLLAALVFFVGSGSFSFERPEPLQATELLGATLAGAALGGSVGIAQWAVLRAWFDRTKHLLLAYPPIAAVGLALAAASMHGGEMIGGLFTGLACLLVPIAFAIVLWRVMHEQLFRAGLWSAANTLLPMLGLLPAGWLASAFGQAPEGNGAGVIALLGALTGSIAAGLLLVQLTQRAQVQRKA
jgi:hypothetical protein